jgi:hypothetical protein
MTATWREKYRKLRKQLLSDMAELAYPGENPFGEDTVAAQQFDEHVDVVASGEVCEVCGYKWCRCDEETD